MQTLDLPGWDDIEYIIRDLKQALDELDVEEVGIPYFRTKIARTIAMMRDDKMLEQHVRKQLVNVDHWNVDTVRTFVLSLEPPVLDVY
ncbi:MAG: hypothetical protein ACFFCS_13420 [Candidatus Hodarchaeota archaeon]